MDDIRAIRAREALQHALASLQEEFDQGLDAAPRSLRRQTVVYLREALLLLTGSYPDVIRH